MKTITTEELNTVTGGASSTDAGVTSQLTALQGSIKDLAANKSSSSSSSESLMPMMMMMAMRPQPAPTVVATGGGAPAAPSSVVNISTRVRRW